MRKIVLTALILGSAFLSYGQANSEEIMLNEDNGVKTLTISTTSNGKTIKETYVADKAEAKLEELEKKGNISKTIVIDETGTMFTRIEYVTSTK